MTKDTAFLDMSDDAFMNSASASGGPAVKEEEPSKEPEVKEPVVAETPQVEEPVEKKIEPEVETTGKVADPHAANADDDNDDDDASNEDGDVDNDEKPTEGEADHIEVDEDEKVVETDVDYAAFYKQIMTPFKANGRTVELKTPQEAVQLMQMGANYTKKMQELIPYRKVMAMLQNNDLMDEGKLGFLIDLEKKDPEAIKKLLKDSGIDPMEIDTSTEPTYNEGNHRVTDEEVSFKQTLEDMKSNPEQVATLKVINDDWDQVSKDSLWSNPGIMTIIHAQRENGIYDRITSEVNRRLTLGTIPANVPFLQAYKNIGDELTAAGAFADLNLKPPVSVQAQQPVTAKVVGTRVAAPKAAVRNNDRAAAASTSRQSSGKSKEPIQNPLEMSDEEFLKLDQFSGRV